MAYTEAQKTEIHKIVKENIGEFVPVHETTYVAQAIIDSTEVDFNKVLASTNKYLDSIYVHPTTVMLNPIFHNHIMIMNNKIRTYLGK